MDAVSVLKSGGVIVYPTDTAYAIGCDATNEEAVQKIFEIKGREQSKTVPLIAGSIEMVNEWAELSGKAEELAREHWPGPLTLVLSVKKQGQTLKQVQGDGLAPAVVKDGWIAVRVPDNKTARELSQALGAPLVSTSANKAGDANCYSVNDVKQSLAHSFSTVDYAIDEGQLPEKEVSTIAKVWDNEIVVLREGAVRIKPKNQNA